MSEPIVNLSGPLDYPRGGEPVSAPMENALYTPLNDPSIIHGATKEKGYAPSDVTMAEVAPFRTGRFPTVMYGYNNEEAYAQDQSFGGKMVSGLGKGIALTGTTFLQTTVGAVNGLVQWGTDGKFSSFYDNDFNRALDKFNKYLEDVLPNYYTEEEKNSPWYSPKHFFTGNMLWDGIVKNLGFSAGAALSGLTFAAALRGFSMIPGISRLMSAGKWAEAAAKAESVAAKAGTLAESVGAVEKVSGLIKSSYSVLNPAQRWVVAGLSTSGEAGIEAYNNRQQFIEGKVSEYEKKYYTKPQGEELKKIIEEADEVGRWSYLSNMGLLTFTNYVQFPKILGSTYKVEKGMSNGVVREIGEIAKDETGKLARVMPKHKLLSKINGIRPYLFSSSEAFEEGAQYVIQTGTQDYYDKKDKGEEADVLASVFEGIKKTLTTTEGMDNLIIGGLSGALMMGRGRFIEGKQKDRATQQAIKEFNEKDLSGFAKDTYEGVKRGVVLQVERLKAIVDGDIQQSKDLEKDYILDYLMPRIKYGRLDLVREDLNDLKQLASTEDGFNQLKKEGKVLEGDTKQAYLARISSFEQTTEKVKDLYQSLNIRYGAAKIKNQKGEWINKYPIDKMVYAASKIADYDSRIESLLPKLITPEFAEKGISIDDIIKDLSEGKADKYNEASAIIESSKDINREEIGQALYDISEMALKRTLFFKEYEDMKASPEKWITKEQPKTTEEEKKETIPGEKEETVELETLKGKKEYVVGKKYFIGTGVNYDKKGLESPVEISEFQIIKDNGDTVDVLTDKGETKTISKDVFKKYHLGDVESLKTNKPANYFYKHRNDIFTFNFGKAKEGKKTGRLEYKDGKLFFVYKAYADKKTGEVKLRRIELKKKHFVAQEGFVNPMLEIKGALRNKEQQQAHDEYLSSEEKDNTLDESARIRAELIADLFVELSGQQKDTSDLITKKKEELKKINNGLELLREDIESENAVNKNIKKVLRFNKHAKKYLDASIRLTREKEQLEEHIATLERQKENIEIALAYVDDTFHYIDETPSDIEEFTDEIKEQVDLLTEVINENTKQISALHRILSKVEEAIDSVMGMLHSLISDFENTYPKVPTAIMGQEWVDFIHDNPNFLTLKPNFKDDLKVLEDLIAETEEFEISPNEKKAQDVREKIEALQKEIKDAEPELIGKKAILDKFAPYVEHLKELRQEEEKLNADSKNAGTIEKTLNSGKTGTRNAVLNDGEYEPEKKKSNELMGKSTITTDDGKAHQKRSNLFGARLSEFKNRDRIKGVYVTSENEHLLFPKKNKEDESLIDFLTRGVDDVDKNDVIVLVIVEQTDDGLTLVGVDGQPLANGVDPLENGIFQVFPAKELTWSEKYGGGTMFRKTTPEEVQQSIRSQYAKWRTKTIESTKGMGSADDLLNATHGIGASFGIPIYIRKGSREIDYSAHTSIEDAQLATENEIKNHSIIEIPTVTDEIEEGSVKYTKAKGRVFLRWGNKLTKLQNRRLNEKEATTVYKVIHALAKEVMQKEGKLSEEGKRLLDYLKSIVYWRLPDAKKGEPEYLGRNNIFFKHDPKTGEPMLYVSDDGTVYKFTPSALEENKGKIIESLQSLFMNINSKMLGKDQIEETYEEITDIDKDGNIVSKKWDNYQSFLLSKKERTNEEIPLYTWMKPVTGENETNREGIYFFVEDDGESPIVPEVKKTTKKTIPFTPGKKVVKEEEQEEAPVKGRTYEEAKKIAARKVKEAIAKEITEQTPATKGKEEEFSVAELSKPVYTLDYATVNVFTTKEGRKVRFIAKSDVSMENYEKAIGIVGDKNGSQFEEIVKIYMGEKEEEKPAPKKKIVRQEAEEEEESFLVADLSDETTVENVEKQTGNKLSPEALDALLNESDEDEKITREITEEIESVTKEDWTLAEKWLNKVFPNIPLYRVKNIIQATNGRQAWGMFKNGALYLYRNAEVGTIYHEVFHGIWNMVSSPEERAKIFNEFKQREGTFYDVKSRQTLKYSDPAVTIKMAEEKMAEEFRDYVHYKKIPPKPKDGRPYIVKLFSDLVNVIKNFFMGEQAQSNVEQLFQRINTGYYKKSIPHESSLNFANKGTIDIEDELATEGADYSLVTLSDRNRADVIEHMTYMILKRFIDDDKSLFTIPDVKKSEIYPKLKEDIFGRLKSKLSSIKKLYKDEKIGEKDFLKRKEEVVRLIANIDSEWDNIVNKHQEYLKKYDVDFDENDHIQLHDDENTGRGDYQDARKIDSFRKANSAIKLFLATIPKTIINEDGEVVGKRTTINGVSLLPSTQVVISLWNKLSSATNIDNMMAKLRQMAEEDSNYRALYKRLMKVEYNSPGNHGFEKVTTVHGMQLIDAFWKVFKKQSPTVMNIFILDNGEVVTGEANLSSAASQFRSEYEGNIIVKARSKKEGFFVWNKKTNKFVGNPASLKDDRGKAISLTTPLEMISFLHKLGIEFTGKELNSLRRNHIDMYREFEKAVNGIKQSILEAKEIVSFGGKTLDIKGRLTTLSFAKALASNPQFDSTYFNVVGERMQSYIGPNAPSNLYDFLSNLELLTPEHLEGTQYEYLLKDSFSLGSNLMKRKFDEEGKQKSSGKELLSVGYAGGIHNNMKGKKKEASRLTYMERLIQEINLNLKGWYLILVQGDASIEWTMNMGNPISVKSLRKGMDDVYSIFGEYFISELNLVRDNRQNIGKKRLEKNKDIALEMRFFKDILSKGKIYNDIMKEEGDSREIYERNKDKINEALKAYIESHTSSLRDHLLHYGVLEETEKGRTLKDIDLPSEMTEAALMNELRALTINYMMANIEMHKLLFSDPYQYDDELKRIKSFLSPRQAIISGSDKINEVYHRVWNKGYKKGTIGYTNFRRDFFKTVTLADLRAIINLPGYSDYDETDGAGVIMMGAYRQFRIRAGDWFDKEEKQYRYDIAWEKQHKGKDITKEEGVLLSEGNPMVQSAYTPLKPIVAGNKANGREYNDIVLDKFALYPLSYRVLMDINTNGGKETSHAISQYDKMQKEDIDYAVFNSGRKVGVEELNSIYNKDNTFKNTTYKGIVNVPFSAISVQTEVPAKGDTSTRGSQATKLVSMDLMDAGVPVDFMGGKEFEERYTKWLSLSEEKKLSESPLYKEIKNNQKLLEALMDDGYITLLNRLGIKEIIDGDGNRTYSFSDFKKTVETLKDEVLKREVNDNLMAALDSFKEGNSVLEATTAYQQIRHILYSIVDKHIISPKMPGGLKVQIPVSFLNENKIKSDVINGKKGYVSDELAFYSKIEEKNEDGKIIKTTVNVCEVMLPRWFKSDKTDKELINYLNNTDEGKKILRGVAFRIPTQKQNSIDVFKIKQFLPREYGDVVVIPSALVQKAGSDFDIDKLTIYLKNTYLDIKGELKTVPFLGYGEEGKNAFRKLYKEGEFLTEKQKKELDRFLAEEADEVRSQFFSKLYDEEGNIIETPENKLIRDIFSEVFTEQSLTREFVDELVGKGLEEKVVNALYKKSLENAYIDSFDKLITHPLNFENLTTPNSAEQLKELAKEMAELTTGKPFDYTAVENMLDRRFMSRLRHAFVSGKQAIAIAAVSQTNNSINQRQPIYINRFLLGRTSSQDKAWLGDGSVKFSKYNRIKIGGEVFPTLSFARNADKTKKQPFGQYISDLISQFIDGYVDISKGPWIMEMGASPNVAPTFLFLVKIGVPIKDVVYFMNQPIIRDYLRELESNGYTWLFNSTIVDKTKLDYATKEEIKKAKAEQKDFRIPSDYVLRQTIGKKSEKLTKEQIDQQLKMLDEFLKYAKMSEHLLHVTQATNYDTATFNDPLLIWKKGQQMERAQKTIISDANDLLRGSFIGHIPGVLRNVQNALSTILLSDRGKVRRTVQDVLIDYVDTNDKDFLKIAKKVVCDLFDWAVQTNGEYNQYVKELFDEGAVTDIADFVDDVKGNPEHPLYGNHIINIIQINPSKKGTPNSVSNIKIRGNDNRAYDQNNIIYSFRELRDYLGADSPIYMGLINVAIVQSGLSPSATSYTSLIPFEDFEKIYSQTINKLESLPLHKFVSLGVFQRNNWDNDDVVTHQNAFWYKPKNGGDKIYNLAMKFLPDNVKKAIADKKIPQMMTIRASNKESNERYIFYTWNQMEELLTKEDLEKIGKDRRAQLSRAFEIQAEMRSRGDFSYKKAALFEKVIGEDGEPLMTEYQGNKNIVYKAINAWGDGAKVNEFYDEEHPSIIDNGLEVAPLVDNNEIIYLFEHPEIEKKERYSSAMADYDEYNEKEVEEEPIVSETNPEEETITLSQGKFKVSEVSSKMLEAMGYSPEEAGDIINKICKGI